MIPLAPNRAGIGAGGVAGTASTETVPARVRVARSLDEVLAAWRLVHECHADQGLIHPNDFGIHTNVHAAAAGSVVLCADANAALSATLTVTPDGPRGLAVDARFRRELDALRRSGERLSELGLIAHRNSGGALEQLIATSIDRALRDDYSGVVMAVSSRHAGYYARRFGFSAVALTPRPRRAGESLALLHLNRSLVAESASPPPGLQLLRGKPVARDFYSGAFGFLSSQLGGSVLLAYLAGLEPTPRLAV